VFTAEVPGNGTDRTWRPPVMSRIALAVCLGFFMALAALLLAVMLVTNQVADGGWIALALAAAAWVVLAWRTLTQSVTLTPDTLVIRNILATRQVPLVDVSEVGFRRGLLTVTSAHGAAASEQFTVSAVNLDSSRWSGLRSNADAIADAITEAAGLPPLPPRREIISRNRAWILLLAAALCFGLGVYCGPLQSGNTGLPFAWREAGVVLFPVGAVMLGLSFRIIRDHYRKRPRQDAPGEKN
jgi:hypothetical protein